MSSEFMESSPYTNTTKPSLLKICMKLMKLRVIVLLQITAICAILVHDLLARHGLTDVDRTWTDTFYACVITVVGGTLSAGGSNAINMWYEREIDAKMKRTKDRPIPSGKIAPENALDFAGVVAFASVPVHRLYSNVSNSPFDCFFYWVLVALRLRPRPSYPSIPSHCQLSCPRVKIGQKSFPAVVSLARQERHAADHRFHVPWQS